MFPFVRFLEARDGNHLCFRFSQSLRVLGDAAKGRKRSLLLYLKIEPSLLYPTVRPSGSGAALSETTAPEALLLKLSQDCVSNAGAKLNRWQRVVEEVGRGA